MRVVPGIPFTTSLFTRVVFFLISRLRQGVGVYLTVRLRFWTPSCFLQQKFYTNAFFLLHRFFFIVHVLELVMRSMCKILRINEHGFALLAGFRKEKNTYFSSTALATIGLACSTKQPLFILIVVRVLHCSCPLICAFLARKAAIWVGGTGSTMSSSTMWSEDSVGPLPASITPSFTSASSPWV